MKKPKFPNQNYVVSFGDPFGGIQLYGPFSSSGEAHDWAESVERKMYDHSWNVVPVISLRQFEEMDNER